MNTSKDLVPNKLDADCEQIKISAQNITKVVSDDGFLLNRQALRTLASSMEKDRVFMSRDDTTIFNPTAGPLIGMNNGSSLISTTAFDSQFVESFIKCFPLPCLYVNVQGLNAKGSDVLHELFGVRASVENSVYDILGLDLGTWILQSKDRIRHAKLNTANGIKELTIHKSEVVVRGDVVGYVCCFIRGQDCLHHNDHANTFIQVMDVSERPMCIVNIADGRVLFANIAWCTRHNFDRSKLINTIGYHIFDRTLTEAISSIDELSEIKTVVTKIKNKIETCELYPVSSEILKAPKYCLIAGVK